MRVYYTIYGAGLDKINLPGELDFDSIEFEYTGGKCRFDFCGEIDMGFEDGTITGCIKSDNRDLYNEEFDTKKMKLALHFGKNFKFIVNYDPEGEADNSVELHSFSAMIEIDGVTRRVNGLINEVE